MKATLHIDEVKYNAKPNRYSGAISNRITGKTTEVEPQQLADAVASGQTVLCGVMNGKRQKANLQSQSLIMLDFDNSKKVDGVEHKYTGKDYMTIQKVMDNPFIKENASFLYKTFSSTADHEKFRAVFFLDKTLTNEYQVSALYSELFKRFPQADIACSDSSRLFFGGVSYVEVDFNNVYNVSEDVLNATAVVKTAKSIKKAPKKAQKAKTPAPEGNVFDYGNPIIEMFENRDVFALREVFNQKYAFVATSVANAVFLIKRFDMNAIFNVPEQFNDWFHYDSNPSAMIKKGDSGVHLYTCFSSGHEFTADIFNITARLTGLAPSKAIDFLFEVFEVKIDKNSDIREIQDKLTLSIDILTNKEVLKAMYPSVNKVIGRGADRYHVATILSMFANSVYEDFNTGEPRVLRIIGVREIASTLGVGRDKVSKLMNTLVDIGMIDKLDTNEIPRYLLTKILEHQLTNKYSRRATVYEVKPTESTDYIFPCEGKCYLSLDTGFTRKAQSRKGILFSRGQEEADRIYNQDKDVQLSELDLKMIKAMKDIIIKTIAKKGYCTEKIILGGLNKRFGKNKAFKADRIKEFLGGLLRETNTQRVRVSKATREQFNLPEEAKTHTFVIIPLEEEQ